MIFPPSHRLNPDMWAEVANDVPADWENFSDDRRKEHFKNRKQTWKGKLNTMFGEAIKKQLQKKSETPTVNDITGSLDNSLEAMFDIAHRVRIGDVVVYVPKVDVHHEHIFCGVVVDEPQSRDAQSNSDIFGCNVEDWMEIGFTGVGISRRIKWTRVFPVVRSKTPVNTLYINHSAYGLNSETGKGRISLGVNMRGFQSIWAGSDPGARAQFIQEISTAPAMDVIPYLVQLAGEPVAPEAGPSLQNHQPQLPDLPKVGSPISFIGPNGQVVTARGVNGWRQVLELCSGNAGNMTNAVLHAAVQNLVHEEPVVPSPEDFWREQQRDPLVANTWWRFKCQGSFDLRFVAVQTLTPIEYVLDVVETLQNERPQVIFTGPPGCGKTFFARSLAQALIKAPRRPKVADGPGTEPSSDRLLDISAHPEFCYSDLVQGFRPLPGGENGGTRYALRDGHLLSFLKRAPTAPAGKEDPLVWIFDEMNRGKVSAILGEIFTCLDYRGEPKLLAQAERPAAPNIQAAGPAADLAAGQAGNGQADARPSPASTELVLPKHLFILATMNDRDEALSRLDIALRDRFYVFEYPERLTNNACRMQASFERYVKLRGFTGFDRFTAGLGQLNERVSKALRGHEIGHARFFKATATAQELSSSIRSRLDRVVIPLLDKLLESHRERDGIIAMVKDLKGTLP